MVFLFLMFWLSFCYREIIFMNLGKTNENQERKRRQEGRVEEIAYFLSLERRYLDSLKKN